ncbi:MAG: uroporphyrinogen-III synthase [Alphaproteobacteria bacterium]
MLTVFSREDAIRALVTRPLEDSAALVGALEGRGIEVFICPMLSIVLNRGPEPDLAGVQAVLFTSANGVRAFAKVAPRRDLPVFAVGDRTSAAAREAGFSTVESAGGDVDSLVRLVRDRCTPDSGALLHPAGSDVAGDLAGRLGAAGFAVRRAVLYHAQAATAFSPEVALALSQHLIDLALLYSPRSAATFVSLARRAGLEKACERLEILCLSKAVAEAADPIMWRRVMIAPRPVQDALLDTLDERLHRQ